MCLLRLCHQKIDGGAMKCIICAIFLFLCSSVAYSGPVINVQYIHDLIAQKWQINVPYHSELTDKNVVANMKYLLTAIDVANKKLNGWPTTSYARSEYATQAAVDTVATETAVNTLIKYMGAPFKIKTTDNTSDFSFSISAKGKFYVNWGDGQETVIEKSDTSEVLYSHAYEVPGQYDIEMGGKATAYNNSNTVAAISFKDNVNIQKISGSLGYIFSTLADKSQPRFYYTFSGNTGLNGQIPPALFYGVSGQPTKNMFYATFGGATGLEGAVPPELFENIVGIPMEGIFYRTFENCSGLTAISADLFKGIVGPPARDMFHSTFSGCVGLPEIPDGLFAGIKGAPAQRMYNATFSGCTGLRGNIPDALFGVFDGSPQELMFGNTFYACSGLSGGIPRNLFEGIKGQPAKRMYEGTFNSCSGLNQPIPAGLFAGISGNPVEKMFYNTFAGCVNLTGMVPDGLFSGVSGSVAPNMFSRTFYNCHAIEGIEGEIFGNLTGDAQTGMFTEMFYRNYAMRGNSATINGRFLYDIWPSAMSAQVGKMYTDDMGLTDYENIPSVWGGP